MSKIWAMVSYVLFIVGLVLSVVGGLFIPEVPWVALLLAIFGLVIGLIHMKAKEINTLLLGNHCLASDDSRLRSGRHSVPRNHWLRPRGLCRSSGASGSYRCDKSTDNNRPRKVSIKGNS